MQTGSKASPVPFEDNGTIVPCLEGFLHAANYAPLLERHRAYWLKVPSGRWRECAVQEERLCHSYKLALNIV